MECKDIRKQSGICLDDVLIETSWNVKLYDVFEGHAFFFRINRNIVECKGERREVFRTLGMVLIETSWNVKFSTESFLDCVVSVLIETSWNVKACSPSNNLTAISINRNIVECKERSWICCMKRDRGINRNIVECKVL